MDADAQRMHSWLGGVRESAPGEYEGPYEDMLEPRRQNSDIYWALLRTRELPHTPRWRSHGVVANQSSPKVSYTSGSDRAKPSTRPKPVQIQPNASPQISECSPSPKEIVQQVLNSPRVQYGIQLIVDESGMDGSVVMQEAREMMKEMAHSLSIAQVRGLGYLFTKFFKAMYRHIYVNREGIDRLRAALEMYPTVLLPTHRSYADFLLVTYMCFEYNLPLPIIAAAQDFLNMKYVSDMLRKCGAFFIRRSFVSDPLYWLLFTEYVRLHVRGVDNPLEFFIEGKRSRTGKSLLPKTGMLGTIFESWFISQVPDIQLIPITISYDRILEENLHAYELLGQPKPKESTSGLLKARSVLSEDFGTVYVHIGEVVSLRNLVNNEVDRSKHALQCRLKSQLYPEEVHCIRQLSRDIVSLQLNNVVISPFHMIACCLLVITQQSVANLPDINNIEQSMTLSTAVSVRQLLFMADDLCRLLRNLGGRVSWPIDSSHFNIVWQMCARMHSRLLVQKTHSKPSFQSSSHVEVVDLQGILVEASFVASMNQHSQSTQITVIPSRELLNNIIADYFLLAMYRNQLIHLLIREAIVIMTLWPYGSAMGLRELQERMRIWSQLFYYEFCLTSTTVEENLNLALGNLKSLGFVEECFQGENPPVYRINDNQRESSMVRVLYEVLKPYVYAYYVACCVSLHEPNESSGVPLGTNSKPKSRLTGKTVQEVSFIILRQHMCKNVASVNCCKLGLQFLCLDTLDNALTSLHRMKPESSSFAPMAFLSSYLAMESNYVRIVHSSIQEWKLSKKQELRPKL